MIPKEKDKMSNNITHSLEIDMVGYSIEEKSTLGQLNIRFDVSDVFVSSVMEDVFGLDFEMLPNTLIKGDGKFALWLGPDERLVILPKDLIRIVEMNLERRLQGRHYSAVDLSSGLVILDIRGRDVRNIISKGCSIDLHQKYFNIGQCFQTLIDKINVVCFPLENDCIRVIIRRSYSKALIRWLEDASLEFV